MTPDLVGSTRVEEPPGEAPPPPPPSTSSVVLEQLNASPSDEQPADSWEEAAVDGDPLLTPENEEVHNILFNRYSSSM